MTIPAKVILPTVTEIMETMYFMSPLYHGETPSQRRDYEIGVEFSGAVRGQFYVAVTRGLAHQMAADFLGAEPGDIDEFQIEATVREFANVTCGVAMSAWMPDVDFQFTVPYEVPADKPASVVHGFNFPGTTPEIWFGATIDG